MNTLPNSQAAMSEMSPRPMPSIASGEIPVFGEDYTPPASDRELVGAEAADFSAAADHFSHDTWSDAGPGRVSDETIQRADKRDEFRRGAVARANRHGYAKGVALGLSMVALIGVAKSPVGEKIGQALSQQDTAQLQRDADTDQIVKERAGSDGLQDPR